MINIESPQFKWGETLAGIYKMTFDDKWIYIGSSDDLKKRFRRWKSVLKTGNHKFNIDIKNILPSTNNIKIEVVEVVSDKNNLRQVEENLISKYWGNNLLLNRCPKPTMGGVAGIRPYNGYVKPTRKKRISGGVTEPSQPIGAFDKNGNLIYEFGSKGECCRIIGTRVITINKHLRGKMGSVKGFSLKSKDSNGSYINPPKFIRKQNVNCKIRKFYQVNSDGVMVNEYLTMNEAAKKLGSVRSHISEVLRKVGGNVSVKGFKLIYATEFHKTLTENTTTLK